MGWRFQKRVSLGNGVRLNIGKKSISISAGVRGARISSNSRRGTQVSVGLPGTGFSYQEHLKNTATDDVSTATKIVDGVSGCAFLWLLVSPGSCLLAGIIAVAVGIVLWRLLTTTIAVAVQVTCGVFLGVLPLFLFVVVASLVLYSNWFSTDHRRWIALGVFCAGVLLNMLVWAFAPQHYPPTVVSRVLSQRSAHPAGNP